MSDAFTNALADRFIEEAFKNNHLDMFGILDAEPPTPIIDMTNKGIGHAGITYKIIRREPPQHFPINTSNFVDLIK